MLPCHAHAFNKTKLVEPIEPPGLLWCVVLKKNQQLLCEFEITGTVGRYHTPVSHGLGFDIS